ncbi:ThiF family adenylyltransferase [Sphingobacterium sp. Mn56C]
MEQYKRQILLPEFGLQGQERLQCAQVVVVGAGGLGSAILPYIAAAGIGKIILLDGDTVELSNLARQASFGLADIGKFKAQVLAEQINTRYQKDIVQPICAYMDGDSDMPWLQTATVLVDGTDNFGSKYRLAALAQQWQLPLVMGALGAWEAQLAVFNYHTQKQYSDIFPEASDQGSCSNGGDGVWSPLVAVTGALMANEVLKICARIGKTFAGKLLLYNAFENSYRSLQFDTAMPEEGATEQQQVEAVAAAVDTERLNQWLQRGQAVCIDVQEIYAHAEQPLSTWNIPLYDLPKVWREQLYHEKRHIVFVCPTAKRSRIACTWLKAFMPCFYHVL